MVEARRRLETGGRAAVGWRQLAAHVGVSPASLYTYFSNLDDLFAELILQSYRSLGDAIEATLQDLASSPAADRALAGPLAYRQWALANRGQFNLIFTDLIAGYEAPPDGASTEAEIAVFRPMAAALAEALGEEPAEPIDSGASVERFIGLWGTFHGLTSLEVNHHLDWIDRERVYETQVRWHLEQLGVSPASDLSDRLRRLGTTRPGTAT